MYIKKFQAGGAAPVAEAAPEQVPMESEAPVQGGAEEQLAQVAQQLLQMLLQEIGDPNAVAAVLQMAMEMLQQVAQGGASQEAPVFKKGGVLRKGGKCGGSMKRK